MSAPAEDVATLADFEGLYRTHFVFVWQCLRRFGVPTAALDDAAQDVFLTAYRRGATYEGRASVRAWLAGIARRIAFRYRRARDRADRRNEALGWVTVAGADLDEQLQRRQAADELQRFVDQLEPAKREVFVLADVLGMRAPEIADTIGVNVNTVYTRLRAARLRFARAFGPATPPLPGDATPPQEAVDRGWRALAGAVGVPLKLLPVVATATATGGGAWAKVAVIALGVGLTATAAAPTVVAPATPTLARTHLTPPGPRPRVVSVARPTQPPTPLAVPSVSPVAPEDEGPIPRRRANKPAPPAEPAAPNTDVATLRVELADIEAVRVALSHGNPRRAIELLDRYDATHARGALRPEARQLRRRARCRIAGSQCKATPRNGNVPGRRRSGA